MEIGAGTKHETSPRPPGGDVCPSGEPSRPVAAEQTQRTAAVGYGHASEIDQNLPFPLQPRHRSMHVNGREEGHSGGHAAATGPTRVGRRKLRGRVWVEREGNPSWRRCQRHVNVRPLHRRGRGAGAWVDEHASVCRGRHADAEAVRTEFTLCWYGWTRSGIDVECSKSLPDPSVGFDFAPIPS